MEEEILTWDRKITLEVQKSNKRLHSSFDSGFAKLFKLPDETFQAVSWKADIHMWAVALVNDSESVWDTLKKKISVDAFYNLQLCVKELGYLREKDIATAQCDIIQRAKNCGWRNQ